MRTVRPNKIAIQSRGCRIWHFFFFYEEQYTFSSLVLNETYGQIARGYRHYRSTIIALWKVSIIKHEKNAGQKPATLDM